MVLLFTFHNSNKENDPGTVSHRQRSTVNPYSKHIPFTQVPAPHRTSTRPLASASNRTSTGTTKSSASLATIDKEPSLIVRGILQKTGCSSRQELMAKRAAEAEANTNKSTTGTNVSKTAPNGAMAAKNRSKATNATTISKTSSVNGSKSSATNRSKAAATNRSTNPKKKTKSKYFP